MGEVDLFFHARANPSSAEGSLLEALGSHLAGAMENMRLNSLEKEAAVSQERHLLEEIDVGVRESYGDVRELLLHFRTRTNTEDIERAQRILMLTVSEDESDLAAALRCAALPAVPATRKLRASTALQKPPSRFTFSMCCANSTSARASTSIAPPVLLRSDQQNGLA